MVPSAQYWGIDQSVVRPDTLGHFPSAIELEESIGPHKEIPWSWKVDIHKEIC